MEPLFFLTTSFLFLAPVCGVSFSEFIYPNFTASHVQFIDYGGSFLSSHNGTFKAAIVNPQAQQDSFYLCIIHELSNTITWSANRDAPISGSGQMNLTPKGITISDEKGNLKWTTPPLKSSVYGVQLTEMGNLVFLDSVNGSLWESFDHPTDTIVIGQRLPAGAFLSSAVSDHNLSTGDYSLKVGASDAELQWQGQMYWKLSMDTKAYMDSSYIVDYMAINRTGLYLFGNGESAVVIRVVLPPSNFRIAKLDASGQFTVLRLSGSGLVQEFAGPDDGCQIPFICGRVGLCTEETAHSSPTCSCPAGFHSATQNASGCVPSDASLSLPIACNSTRNESLMNSSLVSYSRLGYGMDYFSNNFFQPTKYGVNLAICQELCSGDCSCLGIFLKNSSGSCYVIRNMLGTIMSSDTGDNDLVGYIKLFAGQSQTDTKRNNSSKNQDQDFPLPALVLLPFTGLFLCAALAFLWWRRRKLHYTMHSKSGRSNTLSSGDLEAFYIPGLPQKFDYEELEVATDNFKNLIGSGGFGAVYKGILDDKTVVAVKKITNLGVQGKRDFCTEIAVIGNIHHVNLVKLKGFCTQGRQRLLVYEYMNRGSLDRTLFGTGPVMEWQERFDIALGTARGLAYLHSGCEQKIIHCDIKPENILLQHQFQAKISDFGLSKLLTPEQSSLFTTMRGTRGYLAPEWLTNSAISEKTDVYSFGMVLLELVSGRRNCSPRSQSHSMDSNSSGVPSSSSSALGLVYFPLLALEMHEQGKHLELADPRLEGRVTNEEVQKLVCIALCCVQEEPALRPNMGSVVGMLEGGIPVAQPRVESLNFLRFYGRRFTEASMIKEENGQSEVVSVPQADASVNTTIGSTAYFSYVSSHHISGPR